MAKKKARKSAVNRYAHLATAERELDFHEFGVISGAEVKAKTLNFVQKAKSDGLHKIRIITGKGLHSKNGPVVKPQVKRTLTAELQARNIKSFYDEKHNAGGDGALLIDL